MQLPYLAVYATISNAATLPCSVRDEQQCSYPYLRKFTEDISTRSYREPGRNWMKLSKQHSKLPNDIYLGTIYLCPLKGEIKNLGYDNITFNRKGGDVILQGEETPGTRRLMEGAGSFLTYANP